MQLTWPLLLACAAAPLAASAQRLKDYNLWVCPHCEKGIKAADVTDLGCEVGMQNNDWPWVKAALYRFLRELRLEPEQRDVSHVNRLLDFASRPITGECYMGIVSMGFFSFHFMEPDERQDYIQTTLFGGVTFQKMAPLSYWDIYLSGWPVFGLLAAAADVVQKDLAGRWQPKKMVGSSGIDLGPRLCCDFADGKVSSDDESFYSVLNDNMKNLAWLVDSAALPVRVSLDYLARTAQVRCSWGRASAYFALADAILSAPEKKESDGYKATSNSAAARSGVPALTGVSARMWNSSQALVSLGEQNLDGCESNITIFHQMQSVWPFWQLLGRLEQRHLSPPPALHGASTAAPYSPPPAMPSTVHLKWQHLLKRRGLSAKEVSLSPSGTLGAARTTKQASEPACLAEDPSLVHVALSTDPAQVDGLIVTLQSATRSAKSNASRLCFHAFALPEHCTWLSDALRCAFGSALEPLSASNSTAALHFRLHGSAHLLIHSLDASRVRRDVGLSVDEEHGAESNSSAMDDAAFMLGELNIGQARYSDAGNLGAVHNFVRFVLHELLPTLPRVVYLDVDLVVKGDLCELYNTALLREGGALSTVAAVRRTNQPLRVYVNVLQPAVPGWLPSEAPSFNAGVMVIDLERWRSRHVSRLVAEWVALNAQTGQQRQRLWLGESQPPLLLLFHDEVAPLDWTWNVDGLGHRLNYPKEILKQAKVLHWTGPLKPWRHHGVNRKLWEPHTLEYCPQYSFREHTTTCRPDSWHC